MLCSGGYNNNCLCTSADPVALLFVGWKGISGATHVHLKELELFIKMRRGLLFLTSLLCSLPPSHHQWQQVCVKTSIKLDSWPAGSDKRKDMLEPGRKDDVHFGGRWWKRSLLQ